MSSFPRRIAILVLVGLAVRLVYALFVLRGVGVAGDGLEFHLLANQLAAGSGYVEPPVVAGPHVPTADKPPLYPLLLALPSLVGLKSVLAHRVVSCAMGAASVAFVGVLGRRVAGVRAGFAAAAVAAGYPLLVVLDGSLRSESLYVPLVAATLLAAYGVVDRPTLPRAAGLGGLIGAAALTRGEAVALLVLLVFPLASLVPRRRRAALVATCVAACGLVLAPWVVRNWITFDRPLLSTNYGSLLYGANCAPAYGGPLIGSWPCFPVAGPARGNQEAQISSDLGRRGLRYARSHAGRLPAVAFARLLRTADFYRPWSSARLEAAIGGRDLGWERVGLIVYYAVLILAAAGAVLLRRARTALRLLLAPLVLVALVAVTGYGSTRFRVPAEVSLVVLAGVALGRVSWRPG